MSFVSGIGESRRYLHACRERVYAQIDIANFGVT